LFLFLVSNLTNRGTSLLIDIHMSACGFKGYLDFALIDKRELNPVSRR